jgi:hypothetical protein
MGLCNQHPDRGVATDFSYRLPVIKQLDPLRCADDSDRLLPVTDVPSDSIQFNSLISWDGGSFTCY